MTLWSDLNPDPAIEVALDYAGVRPEQGGQNEKRAWSEKFAHACAVAVAQDLRSVREFNNKRILPLSLASGTEPLTPLGMGTTKRIDVTVADVVMGLELGVSLKGLNFRDSKMLNYDKNLTGRLYELGDEVRLVHEHLPHAFMVGVFFLPVASTNDKKTDRAPSSFAHTVLKLRERTGRLDAALAAHSARCDASFVALYTLGEEDEGFKRGVVRFFDVNMAPPRRGRPRVEDTRSLSELTSEIANRAVFGATPQWGPSEPDTPSVVR